MATASLQDTTDEYEVMVEKPVFSNVALACISKIWVLILAFDGYIYGQMVESTKPVQPNCSIGRNLKKAEIYF